MSSLTGKSRPDFSLTFNLGRKDSNEVVEITSEADSQSLMIVLLDAIATWVGIMYNGSETLLRIANDLGRASMPSNESSSQRTVAFKKKSGSMTCLAF
jgi:hypothetical protein